MLREIEEALDNANQIKDAYQDEAGAYRWKSSNRVPFDDMLDTWNLDPEIMAICKAARDKDDREFIAEYRKRMENYEPSDEERFEMRAAFGEGAELVNVITGKKFTV